jgi:hypothetical protein
MANRSSQPRIEFHRFRVTTITPDDANWIPLRRKSLHLKVMRGITA